MGRLRRVSLRSIDLARGALDRLGLTLLPVLVLALGLRI
jgi:hypothetical protein